MKRFFIVILFVLFSMVFAEQESVRERIEKYSGENAHELIELLNTQKGDTLKYVSFLLENCSNNDLAVLTRNVVIKNIKYAILTKSLPYAVYEEEIYLHFVLPHRVTQEPLENWREKFYEELYPIVKDAESIEEAAILVNLWVNEQMTYKPTHGRDQAPLTTIRRGYGRCEESMILYIAAARSVGIPARPASCSYWNFTNSNHAWVEIWTPDGWKYLGEVENSLDRVWFSKTTERSTIITAEAFGNYNSMNTIKQKNNVTYISSIEYYTDYRNCKIIVENSDGKQVENASVRLYATSFGGLFPMIELYTDENGIVEIPLGKGTVWVTAFKDDKLGWKLFDLMNETELKIVLGEDKTLDENFIFRFPIPNSDPNPNEKTEILGDKFYLMRDNSNLKRENRLNSYKKGIEFTEYYDLANSDQERDNEYFEQRKKFLEKCEEIAANTGQFLYVLERNSDPARNKIIIDMIEKWDIKELCEIPDSTAIQNVVDIFQAAKERYAFPDSVFTDQVIGFTWRSATPPQNGWQQEFYDKIVIYADAEPEQTVLNILQFLEDNLIIEEDFVWSYFSGSLNPLEMLNMKYVPEYYRRKVLNCALKILGIPVRWKGRLEYFNGEEFIAAEESEEEEEKDTEAAITVSIFVDDEQAKADPFENFLISRLDDEGLIYYTYFDGENDSLDFNATYRIKPDDSVYLESFIRNGNGDSNVIVKSINGLDKIELHLKTPREYLDNSDKWEKATIERVTDFISSLKSENPKILFIRAEIPNEPEVSMLNRLMDKADKFQKKNVELILYSENRKIDDLQNLENQIKLHKGKKLIRNELGNENYPVIFLFDKDNKIIFSSSGFDLGISDLLLKKVE